MGEARVVNDPLGEWLLFLSRRGPLWRFWLGRPYAYLLGPEANAFVFAHDHLFRWREAFSALVPVDGETALIVSDGDDHTRRRAIVRPGLDRHHVEGYVDVIAATASETVAGLTDRRVFDGYQVFRAAIRRANIRALFGAEIAESADEIGDLLQPLIDLTDLLPDTIEAHRRLNTPRWRRARAARARVDAYVYRKIAEARAGNAPSDHILASLVHDQDGNGGGLSDIEVRDQTVMLIAAGYETTSAAMAWSLYGLASRPDLMADARAEIARVGIRDVAALELVGAVVTEALRLYPPAVMSARYVAEGFTFAGHRIRAGSTVIFSPYATHRDPRLYEDPRAFRPERWLGGARRPASEYLPFGGGAHRCIGSTMATTELTIMLAALLQRGAYTLDPGHPRTKGYAAMRPRSGLPMRLLT